MKATLLYTLLLSAHCLYAQSAKDTVLMDEVVKVESITSRNTMASPFTDLKYQAGRRLSDALGEYSSVYVKNYGNGQLASIAIRGTSASQTDITWNGVKLNLPSLGQIDLALFTLGMQDDVQLVRTGFNGTIGGTLRLHNTVSYDTGITIKAALRAGSFNTFESFAGINYGNGKLSGSTRISYLTSENNFKYTNIFKEGHPLQKQVNAQVRTLSYLQQFNASINSRNQLNFYLWLSDADRRIPPIMSKPESSQRQYDNSIRAMAAWKAKYKQLSMGLTTAYMDDHLRYLDPGANLDNATANRIIRNTFSVAYAFPFSLVTGAEVRYDFEEVKTRGYGGARQRHIVGIKGYADYYLNNGLKLHVALKEDVVDKQPSAFAPEAAVNYTRTLKRPVHVLEGALIASRNFRFPTLNDLYWIPGGNLGLKQEKAFNGELNFKYRYKSLLEVSLNAFAIYVTNWIQWVPDGANWSAMNFKRVFSRGFEAAIKGSNTADNTGRRFRIDGSFSYSFTKTTSLDAMSVYDQSKGKQLIYVPLHSCMVGLQLQYRRFYIRSVNNVVSTLYTSTDNSQWLPGYFVSDVEAGKDFSWRRTEIGLAFRVKNIGNSQYQSVAQRPMPGRNFEGVLRFNFTR